MSTKTNSQVIRFTLNGKQHEAGTSPNALLLDYLRESAGLVSVKSGCREGDCGMCTVLVNGTPAKSCLLKMQAVSGKTVETLEALGTAENLHPLQKAFLETGAIQCGFCTPAQILTAKAFLDKNPNPSEVEIREALTRCFAAARGMCALLSGYESAAVMRGEKPGEYKVPEAGISG